MSVRFTKMQAYGNDYVYVNTFTEEITDPQAFAKEVSDRHFGIGADGLVLICPSAKCDFRMRIFNPDGTEAEMCGNALRSMSKYVYDYKLTDKEEITVETIGGVQHVKLHVKDGVAVNVSAHIGLPRFDKSVVPVNTQKPEFIMEPVTVVDREFKLSSLSWGNPHTVAFIDDDLYEFDVEKYGKAIELYTSIFPQKTNVTFAVVDDENNIRIREWERGTGETIGCGTGCCTAVAVAHRLGMCGSCVKVKQIGGILDVQVNGDGSITMTGPSHVMFDGVYKPFE